MLALLAWPLGAIVNRVVGPNNTEITHGSAVGGFQVFLRGKDLGTGFNPPTILIGTSGQSTCSVHPTSPGTVTFLAATASAAGHISTKATTHTSRSRGCGWLGLQSTEIGHAHSHTGA